MGSGDLPDSCRSGLSLNTMVYGGAEDKRMSNRGKEEYQVFSPSLSPGVTSYTVCLSVGERGRELANRAGGRQAQITV